MNIHVLYPKACSKSGKLLAEMLGATSENPFDTGNYRFNKVDVVFNYGCNTEIVSNKTINHQKAVSICTNKLKTFKALKEANIPIPTFTVKKEEANQWDVIVVRQNLSGKGNDGMSYAYKDEQIPDAKMYVEYFEHETEYRIVVFNGKVVGRYGKEALPDATWDFVKMQAQGFKAIDKACVDASLALNIDFVGFDVVENKEGQFVILEANSGPILTHEVGVAIRKSLLGK